MPPPANKYRLNGRVLVVDDVEENRTLVSYYLRRSGAEVVVAEDGIAAIEGLVGAASSGQGVPRFDLVLMDMQMPRMDGYTAVKHLRQNGFTGPVVALTAHTLTGDRERCLAAGCDDYVPKPINPDSLLKICETLLSRRTAAA